MGQLFLYNVIKDITKEELKCLISVYLLLYPMLWLIF